MAARIRYIPNRVIDTNGIADGASIYVYQTGTTTPVSIYSDSGLTTPLANPYSVNAGAPVPEIFSSTPVASLRVRVVSAGGDVISDDDPYDPPANAADLASTDTDKGAALVAFKQGGVSAVDRTLLAKARENVSVTDFGATGDGVTDDMASFNAAIEFVNENGGGDVRVPKGHYITNGNIRLLDNVRLVGEGYGSWIDSAATTGFARCPIVSGNFGDITSGTGFYAEATYDVGAIAKGSTDVTLVTTGDAANFAVGELVVIASYETWPEAFPENFSKFINLNEVADISGGVIKLKYAIPDAYSDSSGNPTIRRLSGTINGYDGLPLWAAKNCGASNLRITQATGLTSGWYALFACGIKQRFENIWMDGVSTPIGSNGLAQSSFRNITGLYEGGALDFADLQNNNDFDNISLDRFAVNASLGLIGVSFHGGTDIRARNIRCSLGGYGGFSFYKVHRGIFDHPTVIDAGSTEALLGGYGDDVEVFGANIVNPFRHGIVIAGERHNVHGNRIPAVGASGYSIYAFATVDECNVSGNELGTNGAVTANDRFFQATAQSANARVYNNTGYVEGLTSKGRTNWAGFGSTNQTGSYAILKTANIKGTSGIVRGFRVFATGARSGTASTKTLRLRLGSTTIAQVDYAAIDTGTWAVSAVINVRTSNNAAHVHGQGWMGTTLKFNAFQAVTDGLVSDTTITVEGQVANAADSLSVSQFIVEPIVEQLS